MLEGKEKKNHRPIH